MRSIASANYHARQRRRADKARSQAEKLRADLAERLEKIEDERRQILENARSEAVDQMQDLQNEIRELRRSLARSRQPVEALQPIEEQVEIIQERVEAPVIRRAPHIPGEALSRAIRLGDKVYLRALNTQGVVTTLGVEEAEVQVGVLRVRSRLADLELAGSQSDLSSRPASARRKAPQAPSQPANIELPSSPGLELDFHGQRSDEALDAMERYPRLRLSGWIALRAHYSWQRYGQTS